MKEEELLKPRIKLIAPIPKIFSCGIEVGEVWEGREIDGIIMFNLTGAHCMDLEAVQKYPHLFTILDWWQDRKPEEINLQYAKTYAGNSVRQVQCIDIRMETITFTGGKVRKIKQWLPATREEYEARKVNV